MAGQQQYNSGQQMAQENALRQTLAQYGGAAMSGDQNALRAIAGADPIMAQRLMSGTLDMDLARNQDARQEKSTNSGLAVDGAQLEAIRAQTRQATEKHAVTMAAADREMALAELDRALAGATQAQSPEEWDAIMSQSEEGRQYVGAFDKRDMVIAQGLGIKDALSMNAGPSPEDRYQEVGGRLVDLYAENGPQTVMGAEQDPMSAVGKLAADLKAGRIDQQQYDLGVADLAPDSMSVQSDGQGGFSLVQGPGVVGRPLTEAASKDNLYLTMAQGALPDVDALEQSLVGMSAAGNGALGGVPLGGFLQSEDYQKAKNASSEFGAAILRKESGAALTASDHEWLDSRYIPQPGDKPGTVQRKREARQRAIAGLRTGMNPEQIKAVENAIGSIPDMGGEQNGPKPIATVDDYNALPSGAEYVDPQGNRRTKR
jgi:hypothetical protein